MAIQMRRGAYADFDPSKMLPGELAVVTSGDPEGNNGTALYVCFAAGSVKRVSTVEEMAELVHDITGEDVEEMRSEINVALASMETRVNTATSTANSAASQALDAKAQAVQASATANNAAETAEDASERAEAAIAAMGDISELAVPLMSADTRGGAMLGSGLAVSDGKLSLGDVVSDSADGPIYSATAQGWAEQDSTTGKNLLPNNATSQTINGITVSVNPDGSITCSGTSTAAVNLHLVSNNALSLTAGAYVLSTVESMPENVRLRLYDGSSIIDVAPGSTTKAFTLASDSTFNAYINAESGVAMNFTIHPQLETGSTATSYEPYTGGAPSPSPDYPQEIRVARGRNLIDTDVTTNKGAFPFTHKGITYTRNDDGSIHAYGTATSMSDFLLPLPEELPTGAQVVLSGCPSGGGPSTWRLDMYMTSSAIEASDYGNGIAKTITNAINRIRVVVYSGATVDFDFYPQLELGSIATPYVPYGHVGLEVQGRNLLDPSTRRDAYAAGGVASSYDGEKVTLRGTATNTNNAIHGVYGVSGGSVLVGPGTYTLSWFGDPLPNGLRVQVLVDYSQGGISYYIVGSDTSVTFTAAQEVNNVRFYKASSLNGKTVDISGYFMLEAGDTAHEYQPYTHTTTPIPLPLKSDGERWAGGLPDGTADVLTLDSAGRWEWTNNVKEYVYDGDIVKFNGAATNGAGVNRYYSNITDASIGTNASMFASHFTIVSAGSSWNATAQCMAMNTSTQIVVIAPFVTSTTELNTWLSTHNVTVFFPLATPTTEHGYIDLPDVPEGASIDIPELREVGVRCFVPGARELAEHAANWGRRARAEDEEIEDAIADLATRVAALES